tara:strand:+ start:60 stop:488 length:429 start_codon:yes stop_codon:yes gene_type:complete
MKIRDMQLSDVPGVYSLGSNEQGFSVAEEAPTFWDRETLERWARSDNDIALVAEDRGILGFLLATYNATARKGTVENTLVSGDYRARGLGRKLMAEAETRLKSQGAQYLCGMVEEGNTGSVNMCKRQGYTQGEKFYWMHKEI